MNKDFKNQDKFKFIFVFILEESKKVDIDDNIDDNEKVVLKNVKINEPESTIINLNDNGI